MSVCSEPGCPNLQPCSTHSGTGNTSWGNRRDRGTQARFRRAVLTAAGGQCQAVENGRRCPQTTDLHAHHTESGNDDPATGVALCRPHHRAIDRHAR